MYLDSNIDSARFFNGGQVLYLDHASSVETPIKPGIITMSNIHSPLFPVMDVLAKSQNALIKGLDILRRNMHIPMAKAGSAGF
jgi:hypothetical protein